MWFSFLSSSHVSYSVTLCNVTYLTHCGLMSTCAVNTGPVDSLLPDSSKPLPEPMLIDHQLCLEVFASGDFTGTAHDN